MRVTTFVNIEREIDVNVSIEDITNALLGEADTLRHAMIGLGNNSTFMKAITDEMISQMTEAQRNLVASFFEDQARRYRLNPQPPRP